MMKAKKLVDSKRIRARMIMLGLRNRDRFSSMLDIGKLIRY